MCLYAFYFTLVLVLYILTLEGAVPPPPPGLTSLRKCNKYYNISAPEDNFSPLTQEEWNKINEREFEYLPVYAIAGGQNAFPKELPFMAALGYDTDNGIQYYCGGTLISEQFVITAAHCINSRAWGKIKYIRLGDLNLTSSTDNKWAQDFTADEVYVHPNYKYPIKYHDIALIKLDRPVKFTEYVLPACLESKRQDIRYNLFYAAGWGLLGHGESKSDHLQVGNLKHYPGKKCQETFSKDYTLPEGIKHDLQVCVGSYSGTVADTCEGDSGGPMAYRNYMSSTEYVYMIAGITSFGKACGLAYIPAVYTRVVYYTDWIEKIMWPEEFRKKIDSDAIYFPDD